jgi:hypothetical protein
LADFVIKDSYPYIENLELINIFEEPKPLGLFSIDNSYPYYEGLKLIKVFEEPKPMGIFQIDGGYPFLEGHKLIKILEKPYPLGVPIIEKGKYPRYDDLNQIQMGAFCYATNLKEAIIPESVKYIGEFAFRHTQLKEVTIASDCKFYSTSFPDDCRVKFYGQEEDEINFETADGLEFWTLDNSIFVAKEEVK